ncbi:MAG: peptidoglycan-binding domain-containing protein [Gammaproteobacteria bacterium]
MSRPGKQRLILPALVATAALSGCASMQGGTGGDQAAIAEKDKEIAALNSQVNQMKDSLTAEQRARLELETRGAEVEMLPQNAKPGECYARAFVPPVYKTENVRILKSEASESIDVVPEKYQWVDEKVLVKEASERLELVPATYEMVTEKILVMPESTKIVTVPAKYRTETERVLDKPEHTIWKKGTGPITRVDDATGEIMCLVTVPATYNTISKKVLDTPAGTQEIKTPAKYKTVTKRVMKTPPSTRKVVIPAEYGSVRVRKLVETAKTNRTPIPATYGTVSKRELVTDGHMEWRPVLCKTNMTSDIIRRIQTALKKAGHYPGPIDGVIGQGTMAAVKSYQVSKGLATGGITLRTIESLGVKI